MRKIVIISEEIAYYGKTLGGQGAVVFSLIQALKNKYDLVILTLGFKEHSFREIIDGVEVIRIMTPLTKKCASFQEMLSYRPKDIERVYYDFRNGVLKFFMKEFHDIKDIIVHIQHGWAEGLVCKYLKKRGVKLVITFHWLRIQRYLKGLFSNNYFDLRYDYNSIPIWQRWLFSIVKKIFKNEKRFIKFISLFYQFHLKFILPLKIRFYFESEIEAINFADKVIVLNNSMKTYLFWISPYDISNKIEIIGNGVEEKYFTQLNNLVINRIQNRYAFKKEDILLLFVGRIDPRKSIEYLFEAMVYVEIMMPDCKRELKLLIMGECYGIYKNYLVSLKALANRLKRVRVLFLGPIYGEEKLALYDLSTIFILPSVYEPFGLVVLEAMARGKPVIISSFCGSAEVVKDDFGIVVSYDDLSQRGKNLGEAILKMLHTDLITMGAAAKKEAEKYKWDNVVRGFQKVYNLL